ADMRYGRYHPLGNDEVALVHRALLALVVLPLDAVRDDVLIRRGSCLLENLQAPQDDVLAAELLDLLLRLVARAFPDREHRDDGGDARSEEHTSELQSRENLVCRL